MTDILLRTRALRRFGTEGSTCTGAAGILPAALCVGWTDLYMPLSQFNRLLTGCGNGPVSLEKEYLLVTDVQGICDVDFSGKPVILNGQTYTWGGSSTAYPDFARRLFMYFVVPDAAVEAMPQPMSGQPIRWKTTARTPRHWCMS